AIFAMSSNLELQANFADTIKPYLKVTNAVSGMVLWTNASFKVMGVATDDEAVASVDFSLNHGTYSTATTNGIQWNSGPLMLTPGTNFFTVYAQATNGNFSATNTVDIVYAVSNVLTVVTNGKGMISPNYNGQSLRIGENYSMGATGISGFMFTNWTGSVNGNAVFSTNKSTVQFMMESNLIMQANFVDTNRPFLSITNVKSGMLWSNATFTVVGTATDNVAVAAVYFSLNQSGWSNAVTANNWANWSTNLALTPGSNILAAYAVDTSGNASSTNRMSLVYVVTNQLLIDVEGRGTLSPNYSNAWLRIGEDYSITATPASGFAFTNWVISTNFLGGVTTNKPTVQFMMESNLTLQANFAETAKPTVGVLSPVSGTHVTRPVATLTGTAKDVWGIAAVMYQLNNGLWTAVTNSTNGFTNWTAMVQLSGGTNILKTCAENLGGNYSATNTMTLISTNAVALQFSLISKPQNGSGLNLNLTLSPGLSGRIEVSTNLIDWELLTNFTETNGDISIYDPNATTPQRFYRAVVP
ncbi:MAG TPA: hypothetical protein VGY98_18110, partial [Verrucomicrobiae bacterium]|nr:hypothetical protein [Verrucomicrobiae bacterium]